MGTLTTAAATPLSARLIPFRNRRLVTILSAMSQLLDPAEHSPEQQHRPKRGERQARGYTKRDERNASPDGGRPDARRRQMLFFHQSTNPSRYTRLKITTQIPSTKCQ